MAKHYTCSICGNTKKRAGLFTPLPIRFDNSHIMCHDCYEDITKELKRIGTENRIIRMFENNVFTDSLSNDNIFGNCVQSELPFDTILNIKLDPQKAVLYIKQHLPIEEESYEETFQYSDQIFEIGNASFNMTKQKIKFYTDNTDEHISHIYDFCKIKSYEYIEDSKSVVKGGNGIGRAIVGGMLFGGAGAIVGALTAKEQLPDEKVSSMSVLVAIEDNDDISIHRITLIESFLPFSKKSEKYAEVFEDVVKVLSLLDDATAPISNTSDSNVKTTSSTNCLEDDVISSLESLKNLLDKDIITQEEFDVKKKQLLGI